MRRSSLLLTTALICGIGAVASAQSLRQALEEAYSNNPNLAAARAALAVSDETVAAARAAMLPSLSANASASETRQFNPNIDSENWSIGLTLSQTLYAGGRNLLALGAADLALLSDREELIDTEQSILLGAVTAFMDVRRDADVVRLSQNNVRVLNEQLRAANDRFEVGEVTRTDVAQTEARLSLARASLVGSQGNLEATREGYRAIVGSYPTAPQSPDGLPSLPGSAEAVEAIALAEHPRMLAAQFDLAAAEVNLETARRATYPTITGSVSVSRSGSDSDISPPSDANSVSVGIQGSVPIYQGGAIYSGIRSATAGLNAARASLQQNARVTQQAARSTYVLWQSAVSGIRASQEAVRAARIAFDGVTEEASLGARTTLDVLDAEQELLDARTNLTTAVRDEVVARFSVLSEMGRLTAEDLNLNVVVFNPEENYNTVNPPSALGTRRDALLDKILERSGN